VLWFWAPWCPTCRAQGPGVSSLAEKYDGQVNVLGVGGLGDVIDIRDYAAQVQGPLHLIDPDGTVWRHFGVTAQSTYVVLDADGDVVADGYLDDHVLADTVAELVG
jgi:thiol-disulfide isomerase/thioredoxin